MKADKVFDLLKLLNESDELINRNGKRILKFIYQDIYHDIFEVGKEKAAIGHNYGSTNYANAIEPYVKLEKDVSAYLDGTSSILSYFTEMVTDKKTEFIQLLFAKADVFFEMIDNHYYSSSDFTPLSFTFNLYAMLRAYHSHKDDFELFSKIVNDCDRLIDCAVFNNKKNVNSYGLFSPHGIDTLAVKKDYMDKLIDCEWYDKTDIAKENLRLLFNNFTSSASYSESRITPAIKLIDDIDKIYKDYLEVKENGLDIEIDVFDKIAKKYISSQNSYRKTDIWYDKKLFYGNRFEFFNYSLPKAISSSSMTDNLAKRILRLDFSLFDYLNQHSQDNSDSFERIIGIILDSDTFYEVSSKFKDLEKACSLYSDGKTSDACDLIQELRSDKHKKVLDDGRVVGNVNNSINRISSSVVRSVGDRMMECYRKLFDYNVSYLVSSALNRDPSSIEEFTDNFEHSLNTLIEKEKAKEAQRLEEARLKLERQEAARRERERQEAARLEQERLEAIRVASQNARQEASVENSSVGLSGEVDTADNADNESVTEYRLNHSGAEPKEETGFAKLKSIFGKRG